MERISCGHSLNWSYVIHVFTDGEMSYTLCSDNSKGQVISLIWVDCAGLLVNPTIEDSNTNLNFISTISHHTSRQHRINRWEVHEGGADGKWKKDIPGLTVPGHKCPQAAYMLFHVISVAFSAAYENVTGKMTGSWDPRGTLYFPRSPVAITLLVFRSYNLASRCENWTGRYELVESARY